MDALAVNRSAAEMTAHELECVNYISARLCGAPPPAALEENRAMVLELEEAK